MADIRDVETPRISVQRLQLHKLDAPDLFSRFLLGYQIESETALLHLFGLDWFENPENPMMVLKQCLELCARRQVGHDLVAQMILQETPVLICNRHVLGFAEYCTAIDPSFKNYKPKTGEILDLQDDPNGSEKGSPNED